MRAIGDSDSVRRQNRALVLDTLRSSGPMARTNLARATGLSHASITAIVQDMVGQGILTDLAEPAGEDKPRGRPAVKVGFRREAALICLVELDVTRLRLSLVDYDATLIDRIEAPLPPLVFREVEPAAFLGQRIGELLARNDGAAGRLMRIAVALQGILDADGSRLAWSPVPMLAGRDIGQGLAASFGVRTTLWKRGRLLAEGARWLDPDLRNARVATLFVGSTVAMGLSGVTLTGGPGGVTLTGGPGGGATEFGHMNHIPDGALCRCGMRGCIEAYAADYGVLRMAYSVPETTPPAPNLPQGEYERLIGRALDGDRAARRAFNLAGQAIGYGLARLLSLFEPSHIVLVGPGARAYELMQAEIDAALRSSLVGRISGIPQVLTLHDESEPIFHGLAIRTLEELDQGEFAALTATG